MKKVIPLVLLGGAIALAVVIGQRMSTDAMAVVIGVAVGVAASVPTSLLLIALLRKERSSFRDEPREQFNPYPPQLQQPNFIVLDPSQFGAMRNQPMEPLPPPMPDAGMRKISVIGHDDWS